MAETQTELMSGEDPLSPHADDAQHWTEVYQELVHLVAAAIEQGRPGPDTLVSADDAAEVAFIEARLEMLQARLDFWRLRVLQVSREPAGSRAL